VAVLTILVAALTESDSGPGMATRIRQRFADVDDASFELPQRAESPRAAEFLV
jgi:antitoxin FitA